MNLEVELASLLNRHSAENDSDTPDWILARFMLRCLSSWNSAMRERKRCHGGPEDAEAAPVDGVCCGATLPNSGEPNDGEDRSNAAADA
jgi:hypothetical protein